jgi:CRP/FNR family transcriptional regulator, cyclic AMP receptor protein
MATMETRNGIDILAKIQTLPALEAFTEKDLKELLRVSKIMRFRPDELIADERSYEGWIYYLISGRVRIVKNGNEIAVLQRTGDVFGEIGKIMGRSDLSASVQALEESTCLKIDLSTVDGLSSENRFVFRYLIFRGISEVLAKRLRITTEKYMRAKEEIERLKAKAAEAGDER